MPKKLWANTELVTVPVVPANRHDTPYDDVRSDPRYWKVDVEMSRRLALAYTTYGRSPTTLVSGACVCSFHEVTVTPSKVARAWLPANATPGRSSRRTVVTRGARTSTAVSAACTNVARSSKTPGATSAI